MKQNENLAPGKSTVEIPPEDHFASCAFL